MNILISINDSYINQAKIMLSSLKLHNKDNINIFLLYNNISDNNLNDLSNFIVNNIGNFYPIYFNEQIDVPINIDHITIETYFRLYAPYILPNNIDRILYLDCDLIVIDNISNFYNTNLDNNIIAGIDNFDGDNHLYNIRLGLPENNRYINAGVLLIDLNKYRNFITKEEINNFIKNNYSILEYQDQDVINYLFRDYILRVNEIYNYQITQIIDGYETTGNKIIHYCNKFKPWNDNFSKPNKALDYYKLLNDLGMVDECNRLRTIHEYNFNNK